MTPPPTASPLSRRRLLALSGATLAAGSSAVLAACGAAVDDEEASPEREAEILNDVLAQQLAVLEAARRANGNVPAQASGAVAATANLRDRSSQELAAAIGDLGGSPTREPAETVAAESPTEALARQLEESIAAAEAGIGELEPDRRGPVLRAITEDAATLAIMRSTLGEDVAPDAFVMGAAEGSS